MKDIDILRELAKKYSVIANDDINQTRIKLFKGVNDLKQIRPVVLIDEIPWHELNIDGSLTLQCSDPLFKKYEDEMRKAIYKWNNFPCDMYVKPYIGVKKTIRKKGIGIDVFEERIGGEAGISAHQYTDQFENDDDILKLHNDVITYDEIQTLSEYEKISNAIGDIIPVKIVGQDMGYSFGAKPWDDIATYRGVTNLLMDLIMRPEFMHLLVGKLTDIFLDTVRQYEELNLIQPNQEYIHSTSAATDYFNNQAIDYDNVKAKNVWGRGLAQIFAEVSPAMHDEFDIEYMKKAMAPFGLVYYGCCEPLHNKIEIIEKIPNLRKISITPWADVDVAAEKIGKRYVVASKPNPANVATDVLDKEIVTKELQKILSACKRNGCACDIVLKDISTVCNNPNNLKEWSKIAMDLVENY